MNPDTPLIPQLQDPAQLPEQAAQAITAQAEALEEAFHAAVEAEDIFAPEEAEKAMPPEQSAEELIRLVDEMAGADSSPEESPEEAAAEAPAEAELSAADDLALDAQELAQIAAQVTPVQTAPEEGSLGPVQTVPEEDPLGPLLDPEISALLGAEVTAILEADYARRSGRSIPGLKAENAAPASEETPKKVKMAADAPKKAEKAAAPKAEKAEKAEKPAKAQQKQAKKAEKAEKAPKKRAFGWKLFCFFRRLVLVILLVALLAVAAAAMACYTIFNGPSQDAKQMLYSTFMEPSGTKWIPGLFLSDEEIQALENPGNPLPPTADISGEITINFDTDLTGEGNNDEWKDHPDGIRIEHIVGDSYTAHVMIIRDPSRVYLGTSRKDFTVEYPGMRLDYMMERDNAVAGINGGAFWDNGTTDPKVGMYPEGLVIAGGEVRWNTKDTSFPDNGFVGFNNDNVLIVAKSMTAKQAKELGIRDGVVFGPVLIMDGKGNAEVYNNKSGGQNPRTCIGQRADGAVIFLCIDGRQANSLGGTYADCIDILTEYGAVNACNLDGGSSSTMFYRDVYGKYEEKGSVFMVNNYSLLQSQPRRMPTFFLVAPEKEGE